jgi:hypothetical protein
LSNQGSNSIAIGNSASSNGGGFSNYICINATGGDINPDASSSLKIAPVRVAASPFTGRILLYDSTSKEIFYSTGTSGSSKTFVINHPTDINKYLVHACLEGPEAGIYYRGKASITNGANVEIELPEYAKHIGKNFTIQLTEIYSGPESTENKLKTTEVVDGKFTVYGSNGSFYWLVHAERNEIVVEPHKEDYELRGDGPYTYITKK